MPNYIRKATKIDIVYVSQHLRPEDRREVEEGHGLAPLPTLLKTYGQSLSFTVPDGRTAGLAGVDEGGRIWMLTTPAIHDFPITFAREAKRFVDSREEKLLWNIVDKRNTVHLKLLKFLGFKFLREINYGPNYLPFIEFCKCVPQPPLQ